MIAASELAYNELPQISGVLTGEDLFDMGDIGHSEKTNKYYLNLKGLN
jgi:hypothetical protein